MRFNELNLSTELLRGVEKMGFEEASPIQREAIPPLLEGKDVIGQAQTGTGKTAAFGIPMLELITSERTVQGLVLCPTRELCIQVADEISNLGKYKNVRVLPVYGGTSIDRQIKAIKSGSQIIIGTPGRVMDHLRRKTLKFDNLKIAILDEADEMFAMGFREDMKTIFDQTNEDRQTCFFSATMGKEITEFSRVYQTNPLEIKIKHKELTVENIAQHYIELNESMKTEILTRLVDLYNPELTIIFANTKRKVDKLVSDLSTRGFNADGLHGDLRQNQRDNVMKRFRDGAIDILVATDVAARGIDVGNVDLVINFDLPQDEEYYVHRIGRTARAGRTGRAISFVTGSDINKLRDIIKYTKADMTYLEIPTIDDMNFKSVEILQKTIEDELAKNEDLSRFRGIIDNLLMQDNTPTEIVEVLLKLLLDSKSNTRHEKLAQVDYGEKFNIRKNKSRKPNRKDSKSSRGSRNSKGGKIFINKGTRDKLNKRTVLSLLEEAGVPKKEVGDIALNRNFSFVHLPKKYVDTAIKGLNSKSVQGKKISAEKSNN